MDKGMKYIHEKMEAGKANCFRKDDQGVIWFKDRIVVPKDAEVRQQILDEAHLKGSAYGNCWTFTIIADTNLEMGRHQYVFCCGITQDIKRI
jgi:hypothetical protein